MQICISKNCTKEAKFRNFCNACYTKNLRNGNIKPFTATDKLKHRLSSLDLINKTAICTTCGLVDITPAGKSWKCKAYTNKKAREYSKKSRIKRKESLADCCDICGSKEKLCWDHCHKTNKFRGTLCNSCNVGIGFLKDDISILKKAITYIERHNNDNYSSTL